jgi:Flp pilus assembly protein TadD
MKRFVALGFAVVLGGLPAQSQNSAAPVQKPAATAEKPGVEAHLSRGNELMQKQLLDEAASEFEKAVAARPEDPRAHFQYAVCLLALGRNDEARKQFEEVQKLAGPSPYLTYYFGRLDLMSNDYASAIKRLASVAENPPFPDTAFHLGVAYISDGDTENGIKWLERAVKLMPDDYRVHYRLARAYSTAGREQEAAREYSLYTKFLNEHKNTETEVRACTDALRTQTLTAAHEVCQRMFDPNDPERLTLLGQVYGDAGAFDYALAPLERATQLDPNSYEAWHDLGLTYYRLKRYKEAREPLEKAVQLRPEAYGSVLLLGSTLYVLGDDEAAIPVLEHALRLKPDDAQTAAVLQQLRAEQGKK